MSAWDKTVRIASVAAIAIAATLTISGRAGATPAAALQLTSNGALGNISSYIYDASPWLLNTDDGNLYVCSPSAPMSQI